MTRRQAIIGIDVGGTKISSALFDIRGDLISKEVGQVADRKGNEVIDLIVSLAQGLIVMGRQSNYQIAAIGLCVPGIYNPQEGTAWAPNIPGWDHIPIWHELRNRLDEPSMNIVIESDRSCYILGEIWKGAARDCTDAIFMSVGTGIGAGILANGQIIAGRSGIGGAIGWMALEPPYDKKYDPWGNFEHFASGNGLARYASEILQNTRISKSLLKVPGSKGITSYDIFEAYEKNDSVSTIVIEKAVSYWGMAVANLISIFNPQKIIFGGGVFGPAHQFIGKIKEEASLWAQPLAMKEVTLLLSALGGDAGLIGAGYLAFRTLDNDDDE